MDSKLRNKLEVIRERHQELAQLLCDEQVIADSRKLTELSKEHAEASPIVEKLGELEALEAQLVSAREMLADPDFKEMAESDIASCEAAMIEVERALEIALVPKDPHADRDSVLEIRAGTGGEEAALFAADLWRLYSRHAETRGWKVEVASLSEASAGGLKEVVATIRGRGVYGMLKYESGVHRVQRVPATEAQGRIHTSTATVAVMPEAEEVDLVLNPSDLRIDVMRSSGSGGQHVNTTDSAVRVTHIPTGMAVHSQQEKSQIKNREIAMRLLRSRLLDIEIQKRNAERAAHRKDQVGSGDRAEKIRTYNYPQDRITDHRIGYTRHDLPGFMNGDISDLTEVLARHELAERLAEGDSPH